jgi:uncharacterized membrane protein YcjF (UPF0283 family)
VNKHIVLQKYLTKTNNKEEIKMTNEKTNKTVDAVVEDGVAKEVNTEETKKEETKQEETKAEEKGNEDMKEETKKEETKAEEKKEEKKEAAPVKKKMSTKKKVFIGLGITGLVAAAGAVIYTLVNNKDDNKSDESGSDTTVTFF